jgi:hypothetical protein
MAVIAVISKCAAASDTLVPLPVIGANFNMTTKVLIPEIISAMITRRAIYSFGICFIII